LEALKIAHDLHDYEVVQTAKLGSVFHASGIRCGHCPKPRHRLPWHACSTSSVRRKPEACSCCRCRTKKDCPGFQSLVFPTAAVGADGVTSLSRGCTNVAPGGTSRGRPEIDVRVLNVITAVPGSMVTCHSYCVRQVPATGNGSRNGRSGSSWPSSFRLLRRVWQRLQPAANLEEVLLVPGLTSDEHPVALPVELSY
jgi:hypothetical protein